MQKVFVRSISNWNLELSCFLRRKGKEINPEEPIRSRKRINSRENLGSMWNTLPTLVVRKSTHHYVTLGLISVKLKTREYIWMFYDPLVTALKREKTSLKFYAGTDPDRFPPILRYKNLQLTGETQPSPRPLEGHGFLIRRWRCRKTMTSFVSIHPWNGKRWLSLS